MRRKKKPTVADKTQKAPWETQPENANEAEVESSSAGESDSSDREGEPLRLNLESEKWGLTGKVDCLRRRDGRLIPYEHKRGRSARSADDKPEAWASERLQAIAFPL